MTEKDSTISPQTSVYVHTVRNHLHTREERHVKSEEREVQREGKEEREVERGKER